MRTVREFQLDTISEAGIQELSLPVGARIVSVAYVGPIPTLWCEEEDDAQLEQRTFHLYETGQPLSAGAHFAGTLVREDGDTWVARHLYVAPERDDG